MTKDDLRRYGSIRRELADIARRLHALEESKGCHGVTYGDSPHQQGEPLSEAQRYVEKKDALERLYRRKQCILLEEQAAVENAIDTPAAGAASADAAAVSGRHDLRTGLRGTALLLGHVPPVAQKGTGDAGIIV